MTIHLIESSAGVYFWSENDGKVTIFFETQKLSISSYGVIIDGYFKFRAIFQTENAL
jgi:hypothetical protein